MTEQPYCIVLGYIVWALAYIGARISARKEVSEYGIEKTLANSKYLVLKRGWVENQL